jgi:hypothetical protein
MIKIRCIFIPILAICSLLTCAQGSFEIIFEDSLDTRCTHTFQDNEGYFITLGYTGRPDISEINGVILRFNNDGDVIKQVFYKEGKILGFQFGFQLSNGNYFIAGTISDSNEITSNNLYILEINTELQILDEKIYPVPEIYNNLFLHNLHYDGDSTVIVNGALNTPAPGFQNHLYAARLNTEGELVDTLIHTMFKADLYSGILQKSDKTGYYFLGSFSFVSMIILDNNLNITGWIPMNPNSISGPIGARWLSDGSIIIASLVYQEVPGAFYDLNVRVCDTMLNVIKDTVIFDTGKNFLPAFEGLDYTDENSIWVVTHPQGVVATKEWEYGRIYIFDPDLNVKGSKYFGGTKSKYLFSIKALEDGGCIITGAIANQSNKGYADVYIKKVMPDIILQHAEDIPEFDFQDVLLFPVPFENEIMLETYRPDLSFSLFTLDGKCIISDTRLQIPHTRVNTTGLDKGFYLYSISYKNRIIQSGKLIKQ